MYVFFGFFLRISVLRRVCISCVCVFLVNCVCVWMFGCLGMLMGVIFFFWDKGLRVCM